MNDSRRDGSTEDDSVSYKGVFSPAIQVAIQITIQNVMSHIKSDWWGEEHSHRDSALLDCCHMTFPVCFPPLTCGMTSQLSTGMCSLIGSFDNCGSYLPETTKILEGRDQLPFSFSTYPNPAHLVCASGEEKLWGG